MYLKAARGTGIKVEANVRNFNDLLPKDMFDSGRLGSTTTWVKLSLEELAIKAIDSVKIILMVK